GYMATGWCHPLERWVELFRRWIDLPEPEALLEASIFFDFRRVAGDLDLNPLEEVMAIAADRPRFLAHLAAVGLELRPPLGLFSRIVADDEGIDLKQQGLAPIVALARHFALQVGSRERSTVARLQAAGQAGALPPEGSEALAEAFRYLGRLRLERQVRDVAAGDPPGNRVALDRLSSIQRRHLKEAFVAVRHVQEAVAERYTTDRLG
ncbi:MAG: putative nucleotidyltransferase substrate binding domain-containing protein, partial [Acidimicrobiia bacterium]